MNRQKEAQQLEKQIQKALKGATSKAKYIGRYVGAQGHEKRKPDEQSQLIFWGHTMPELRNLMKQKWLPHLTPTEQLQVWLELARMSPIYEVRSLSYLWLSQKKQQELRQQNQKAIFELASFIDNWALSDSLSMLLAELLEKDPSHHSLYEKWNRSQNPWLRRQSLVGIYGYARFRKNHHPIQKVYPLLENLLEDPHFYVQRGVGWTLRELDRINPKVQRAFVRKHLHKISGVAWFATSELYPASLKKELVQLRKNQRSFQKNKISGAKKK